MSRIENDVYETPEPLADIIVQRFVDLVDLNAINTPPMVLEPGCGSGSFIKAIRKYYPESYIEALDIRPECEESAKKVGANNFYCGDYKTFLPYSGFDVIIGNPPYSMADEFISKSLELLNDNGYIAFLLRLNYLGGRKRFAFYNEHPLENLIPISGRPSFTKGATDSCEYGVFVWRKTPSGFSTIEKPIWNPNGRTSNTGRLST